MAFFFFYKTPTFFSQCSAGKEITFTLFYFFSCPYCIININNLISNNDERVREARESVALKIEILRRAEVESEAKWAKKLVGLSSLPRDVVNDFFAEKTQEKRKADEAARIAREILDDLISGASEEDESFQEAKIIFNSKMRALQRTEQELLILDNKKNPVKKRTIMPPREVESTAEDRQVEVPKSKDPKEDARRALAQSHRLEEEAQSQIQASQARRKRYQTPKQEAIRSSEAIVKPIHDVFIELSGVFLKNSEFKEINQVKRYTAYIDEVSQLMSEIARGSVKNQKDVESKYSTIQAAAVIDMNKEHSQLFVLISNAFLSMLVILLFFMTKNYLKGGNFFPVQRADARTEALFQRVTEANRELLLNLLSEINPQAAHSSDENPFNPDEDGTTYVTY